VAFENHVAESEIKICKQETSSDANLSGETFYFYLSVNGSQSTVIPLTIGPVTASNPTGLVCSGMYGYFPVVQRDGDPSAATVTEAATSILGVQVTGINVDGYKQVGTGGITAISDLLTAPSAGVTFSPSGIDVVTFTNGRTGPAPA